LGVGRQVDNTGWVSTPANDVPIRLVVGRRHVDLAPLTRSLFHLAEDVGEVLDG
jgi:hypothetical protein